MDVCQTLGGEWSGVVGREGGGYAQELLPNQYALLLFSAFFFFFFSFFFFFLIHTCQLMRTDDGDDYDNDEDDG